VEVKENKGCNGKLAFFQLNYSRSVDSLSVAETATCAQHQNPPAWESQILPPKVALFILKTKRKGFAPPGLKKGH
jgi:hypothetical protein